MADKAKNASGSEICKDYYAFGMPLPGRSYNNTQYRFGFNEQEKDDEWTGTTGSHLAFLFREYDSRICRFFAVDPLTGEFPWQSPYSAFDLNPINKIDPDGRAATNPDWFENENTGEVANVKGKSEMPKSAGTGWVNIGKDDKFGAQNIPVGPAGTVTKMNTEKSKEFMSAQGFTLSPKQIFKYTNSNPQTFQTGSEHVNIEYGSETTINEKFTYVGNSMTAATEGKNILYESDYSLFKGTETFERLPLTYSKPTLGKVTWDYVMQGNKLVQAAFGGNLDYKITKPLEAGMKYLHHIFSTNIDLIKYRFTPVEEQRTLINKFHPLG